MYVRCRKCGWQQDDFWTENYNPISKLKDWEADLFSDNFREWRPDLVTDDLDFLAEHGSVSMQEIIALEVEKTANNIRNMVFRTYKEFREAGCKCPECNEILDVD
jgi:hypothetical protein